MSKIQCLDDHLINQIAAGEAIAAPVDVLKELLDNALDAGATKIEVAIEGGGRSLLQVRDNGEGMDRADAQNCFQRHATSKVRQLQDVTALQTRGFRGEALAAIASVASVELITGESFDTPSTQCHYLYGTQVSVSAHAPYHGSIFTVRDLFARTPVRQKYRRTLAREMADIVRMFAQLVLAHPHVHFTLMRDKKMVFTFLPEEDPIEGTRQRARTLFGEIWKEAKAIAITLDEPYPVTVQGLLVPPQHARSNRTGQFLWMLQRPVTIPAIGRAVEKGYGALVPAGAFPQFMLFLSLPPECVDFNAHPQKKEIRLQYEANLSSAITQAIAQEHGAPGHSEPLPVFDTVTPIVPTAAHFEWKEPAPPPVCESVDTPLFLIDYIREGSLAFVPWSCAQQWPGFETWAAAPQSAKSHGWLLLSLPHIAMLLWYYAPRSPFTRSMQRLLEPHLFTVAEGDRIERILPELLTKGIEIQRLSTKEFAIVALPSWGITPEFIASHLVDWSEAMTPNRLLMQCLSFAQEHLRWKSKDLASDLMLWLTLPNRFDPIGGTYPVTYLSNKKLYAELQKTPPTPSTNS